MLTVPECRPDGSVRGISAEKQRKTQILPQSLAKNRCRRHSSVMNVQTPTPFPGKKPSDERVAFNRSELGIIMSLYGRFVAAGNDLGLGCRDAVAKTELFGKDLAGLELGG